MEQLDLDIIRHNLWEDKFDDCPECGGLGFFEMSDCCNASIKYVDTICDQCGEHCDKSRCDKSRCERCNGTGTIEKDLWDEN